jgi:hypothetical protein
MGFREGMNFVLWLDLGELLEVGVEDVTLEDEADVLELLDVVGEGGGADVVGAMQSAAGHGVAAGSDLACGRPYSLYSATKTKREDHATGKDPAIRHLAVRLFKSDPTPPKMAWDVGPRTMLARRHKDRET